MIGAVAAAAGAAWLLAFGLSAAAARLSPPRAGPLDPWQQPAWERPALVNLAVTQCRLNGAAYSATILDLAARGYFAITERSPGQLWCDLPASPAPDSGLVPSESLVLAGAMALAGPDGAPLEALAESCASDLRGRWDPFERTVRAEGRAAGITRPRLPAGGRLLLYAGAGGVGVLTFAAMSSRPHAGLWAPLVTAFFVLAMPAYWVRSLGRQDRLTGTGAALAAWAAREAADSPDRWSTSGLCTAGAPAQVTRLALAVAAGAMVPFAGLRPGLATGVRPGRRLAGVRTGISGQFTGTPRPEAAWSSFGGQWRLVRVSPTAFQRIHPGVWLALSTWLALLAYVTSLLAGAPGLVLPALLTVACAAAAAGGIRGLAAWLAKPAEISFPAQVIARWVEHRSASDDDWYVPCVAVDDGERCWSFDVGRAAFGSLALGDTVAVRASPRSGKLLAVVPEQGLPDATGHTGSAQLTDPAKPTGPVEFTRPVEFTGPAGSFGHSGPTGGTEAAADTLFGRVPSPGGPEVLAGAGVAARVPRGPVPGALLTADEISAAVGRPVQAIGLGGWTASALYRGEGVTVIVTAAEGITGSLSYRPARRFGRPLPGVGDEAWLLNRDRTVVLRVGEIIAKVTVGGSAARSLPPDVVPGLAATLAGRLPEHSPAPGPPISS